MQKEPPENNLPEVTQETDPRPSAENGKLKKSLDSYRSKKIQHKNITQQYINKRIRSSDHAAKKQFPFGP